MVFVFTPYTFLYLSIYFLFLSILLTVSNFYYFWVYIEIIILLFIGIGYSILLSSTSQFITYFLIQSISSFSLLIFYIYSLPSVFTLFLLIKLSIFPFCFWYINITYVFSNFLFWFVRTVHKLPPLLILKMFTLMLNINILWISIILSVLFSAFIILSSLDLRMLLVVSSVGNNSWFILGQILNLFIFTIYFIIYSIRLYYIISYFKTLSNLNLSYISNKSVYRYRFILLNLSGIPPFPLFFFKIIIVVLICYIYSFNFLFFLFIFSSALIFIGYLSSIIKYFSYFFSSQLILISH